VNDPRPVVAHLVHHYAAPTETLVVNQIESISRYRVVVGCHHRYRDSLFPFVDGVVAVDILGPVAGRLDRLAYAARALPTPFAASAVARAIKAQNRALAHVHYLSDACYFHGTLRRLGVPFLISGYGYDVSWFPHSVRGLAGVLVRRAFREATAVLAMSSDMRRDLIELGCASDKIITHYYGSDAARFARTQPPEPRSGEIRLLSSCGRLAEKKGLEITLAALAMLRDRGVTGWRSTVLGDGPARPRIERLISRLGLAERVHLAGHIAYTGDDLRAHYHRADVLVQPSVWTDAGDKEGIPGVIVEGMASGLAVVASRHALFPERRLPNHKRERILSRGPEAQVERASVRVAVRGAATHAGHAGVSAKRAEHCRRGIGGSPRRRREAMASPRPPEPARHGDVLAPESGSLHESTHLTHLIRDGGPVRAPAPKIVTAGLPRSLRRILRRRRARARATTAEGETPLLRVVAALDERLGPFPEFVAEPTAIARSALAAA
jgi:colanic acid/amylovoran biosynthesis glycosyltransferase